MQITFENYSDQHNLKLPSFIIPGTPSRHHSSVHYLRTVAKQEDSQGMLAIMLDSFTDLKRSSTVCVKSKLTSLN